MCDKSITHVAIAGVIKRPFYIQKKYLRLSLVVQAPSQPVPRADEVPFPPISQPGKRVGLDAMVLEPVLRLLDTYLAAFPWS
jgi:hypothetical protein